MNILATICARGGSKGVKDKNIKEINGKPLIAYTIETAKRWAKASHIICSTDSELIAGIALKYGAEVPFKRPAELAGDNIGKVAVIRHAFRTAEQIYKQKYDLVIDLDVTNPIRNPQDLDNCLKIMKEKKPEALVSVVKSRKNPYFNMFELNKKGFAGLSKKPKSLFMSRQQTPQVYDVNASIYFYSRKFLLNEKYESVISSRKVAIYEMDESSAIDLDSLMDFAYLEFLIKEKVVQL